jgi:hypothetical protein
VFKVALETVGVFAITMVDSALPGKSWETPRGLNFRALGKDMLSWNSVIPRFCY